MGRHFSESDLHRAYLRSRLAAKMTFEQALADTYNRKLLETIARGLPAMDAKHQMRPQPRNLVNIHNQRQAMQPLPPDTIPGVRPLDRKRLAAGEKPEPDDE